MVICALLVKQSLASVIQKQYPDMSLKNVFNRNPAIQLHENSHAAVWSQ